MNKYEEAYEVIDTILHLMCGEENESGFNPTHDEMVESMKVFKELVKKATPKKAILVHDYDGYVYECPNCHNDFRPNYFVNDITWKGCPYCLQTLDWSEEE